MPTSICAARRYLGRLRMTLMATRILRLRSQASTTRPKVPSPICDKILYRGVMSEPSCTTKWPLSSSHDCRPVIVWPGVNTALAAASAASLSSCAWVAGSPSGAITRGNTSSPG
eukprot:Amastigsp_a177848_155.p3 type:complete len:114 gc:universal Amastigsp_a177848_155:502-161(-)